MSKHTPGPWLIEDRDSNGCTLGPWIMTDRSPSGHRRIVASVAGAPYLEVDGGENTFSNARLIAAAPDLLEACCAMLRTWGTDDEDAIIASRDMAAAAIAKAEGGAS